MSLAYKMPPRRRDGAGKPRKAGFEFEFGNLAVLNTAEALQKALGGNLTSSSPFEAVLRDSQVGKLKIERDAELLKSVQYRRWLSNLGVAFSPGSLAHEIESNIDSASSALIPCEVVTDPIAFDELAHIDTLTDTLEALGAEGTQEKLIYAFGLHINVSIPDSSPETLRRYLQAFLLLYAWFIEASDIDITRRFFTKYIDPFPVQYMSLVLDTEYAPTEEQLVAHYMEYNPTRNRALDMLPIFAGLQPDLVQAALPADERKLVKARPAFHFRLPDCKLDVPGWSAAQPWNQWVHIECLAHDEALLEELMAAWRRSSERFSLVPGTAWVMELTRILSEKYLTGLAG